MYSARARYICMFAHSHSHAHTPNALPKFMNIEHCVGNCAGCTYCQTTSAHEIIRSTTHSHSRDNSRLHPRQSPFSAPYQDQPTENDVLVSLSLFSGSHEMNSVFMQVHLQCALCFFSSFYAICEYMFCISSFRRQRNTRREEQNGIEFHLRQRTQLYNLDT